MRAVMNIKVIMTLCCVLSLSFIADCRAASDIIIIKSALAWRADAQGDYLFKNSGNLSGTTISSDGCVEYASGNGIYELKTPYAAESLIKSITVNWAFTGKVTLEVCATGKDSDYAAVVNGVPLKKGFIEGSSLKWRATLAPGSKLSEVRINYEDILGIESSWGNPNLSGFKFRKPLFIKGDSKEELFNYPVLIKIGESSKSEKCDFYIKGIIQSDFADIRFTQADQETLLPHWVETITGKAPSRVASVWVNIPQIPSAGLKIFLYYGKDKARNLTDGQKVFDFFDDFKEGNLDAKKWQDYAFEDNGVVVEYKAKTGAQIKTLNTTGLTIDAIIKLFQDVSAYEWVRARKTTATPAVVDIINTKAAGEEAPNLADFQGLKTAANGDLVLNDYSMEGIYISPDYFPVFEARIMIPAWKAVSPLGSSIGVDISADNENFRKDCQSEDYYYAGRKDFVRGSKLKWSMRLSKNSAVSLSPRTQYFSLDYRPGTITLVSPDGGEKLTGNSEYKIIWSAWEYEPSYRMKLEYSKDGGVTYNLINEAVDNTGTYIWLVPDIASGKVLIKISDALSEDVYDISNNVFLISLSAQAQKTLAKQAKLNLKQEIPAAEAVPVVTAKKSVEIIKRSSLDKGILNKYIKPTKEQEKQIIEPKENIQEEDIDLNVDITKYLTPNRRQGTKLYDVMVKLGDNYSSNTENDAKESYKNGDIVLIMPHGYKWSQTERDSFLIVGMYLTSAEAAKLVMPKEIDTGERDANGQPVMKIVKRSLTRIDPAKFGLEKDARNKTAKLRKIQSLTKDKAVTIQILEEKK
ncbi:MAG: DUF2341 domain-containing protein [Candidatus Omnitrophota bacterium]